MESNPFGDKEKMLYWGCVPDQECRKASDTPIDCSSHCCIEKTAEFSLSGI